MDQDLLLSATNGKPYRNLFHIDVKKLAHFYNARYRITGDLEHGLSVGIGYDRVGSDIDDAKWLANCEVLAIERQATTIGLKRRAMPWLNGRR